MHELDLDFSIIKQSGVSQHDFALLAGVSRVTVNLWVGGAEPSRFLREKLADLLSAMKAATDHGKLPLTRPRRYPNDKRISDLKIAIGLPN